MTGALDKIKRWLLGRGAAVEEVAEGGEPVASPAPGSGDERETSTNAQVEGAADEPWPGRD